MILSNALGTTSELWASQLPALEDRFRVVLYDHLPRARVEQLGSDVLSLADEFEIGRFAFCGLSLGGMVGMWLGAYAGERVEKLVLACTSARFGIPEAWGARAAHVRAEGMAAVAYDAVDTWFTPSYPDREPFLEMQLGMEPDEYSAGLEAIGEFDFRDRLGSVDVPTLVIAGAEDTATTPEDAVVIAEGIPGSRLVVLENAAHLANVEQPGPFNAALVEHLLG